MTDGERKLIAETPITMDCFEMDYFEKTFYGVISNWNSLIDFLERLRRSYNETKDKRILKELIRLLPNSYKVVKLW